MRFKTWEAFLLEFFLLLLDMLILLELEFLSSCKVFRGLYSGDASSSLQFYNVNIVSIFLH